MVYHNPYRAIRIYLGLALGCAEMGNKPLLGLVTIIVGEFLLQ
jgi:hypothetical protein